MGVGAEVDDPDLVALGSGLLHDGQQVRGEDDMAHVLESRTILGRIQIWKGWDIH